MCMCWGESWGGGSKGGGGRLNPLNKKKMRHYHTLTWPQNAGTHILEDLNFKIFMGEDFLGSPNRGQPCVNQLSMFLLRQAWLAL